jgi:hypothetical protein
MENLVQERLKIGWNRYGRGLLHPANDRLRFRQELVEELLDAVIYAAADVVRNKPQVLLRVSFDDDGRAKTRLTVQYEGDHDGNDAILDEISYQMKRSYDYGRKRTDVEDVLLICMFALSSVLERNHV